MLPSVSVGRERGVGIFASPDGLGLQEPRIFVEVKHREASMGAPQAGSSSAPPAWRSLPVREHGRIHRDARIEAMLTSIPLPSRDDAGACRLLLEHYDGSMGDPGPRPSAAAVLARRSVGRRCSWHVTRGSALPVSTPTLTRCLGRRDCGRPTCTPNPLTVRQTP